MKPKGLYPGLCVAGSSIRTENMSVKKRVSRRYAVCIRNEGNEASLERNKLYVVLPDRKAQTDGLVRVIDEDGEDYLYPAEWFVALAVPRVVALSLLKVS